MDAFPIRWRATWRTFLLSPGIALVVIWVETQLDERTASPLLPIRQFLWPILIVELILVVKLFRNREYWPEENTWNVVCFFCQLGFVFLCAIVGEWLWDGVFLPIYRTLSLFRYAYLFVPCSLLMLVFLGVTGAVFWRLAAAQWLTLQLIRLYLHYDPGGYWYYRVRGMAYQVIRRQTPSPRFVGVLQSLIEFETAHLSDDLQAFEIHTRNRLAVAPAEAAAPFKPASTIKAAQRLGQHRQALARHLAPDYAAETTPAQERAQALHQWLENWLMACRLDRVLDSSAMNTDFFRKQALLGCKRQQASLVTASPERPLIDFLVVALQSSSNAAAPLNDDLIQKAEASLLPTGPSASSGVPEQAWIRLSLEIWVECLARRQDFQAVVHFCTRFVRSPYGQVPSVAHIAYQRLGYAWWDYARHVPETDYRSLAWQQAKDSFMQGHCLLPLEMLVIP